MKSWYGELKISLWECYILTSFNYHVIECLTGLGVSMNPAAKSPMYESHEDLLRCDSRGWASRQGSNKIKRPEINLFINLKNFIPIHNITQNHNNVLPK